MGTQIGVEIGGTFTDMVYVKPDGSLGVGKVPSTPAAVEIAVKSVIDEAGIDLGKVRLITHGSTVATNALLTRNGAKVGLLTTKGFKDVVQIGRHDRVGNIYEIRYKKSPPPFPRRLVREIDERIGVDGSVVTPLDRRDAIVQIDALVEADVDVVAICLLHSYKNAEHEKMLLELIRERAPNIAVFASHDVSPEFREYERTITTGVNAFVGPIVQEYIHRLKANLEAGRYGGVLRIMQSNGGTMPSHAAGSNAARMLLSGPAAGARAAIWFARRNGIDNILTLDMGGTSSDVAIAPNLEAQMVSEVLIDNLPVRTAAVDIATIGAGGGSIAALDAGGFLSVGPQSAGAVPGPACYGRGGTLATVTDAQVIAGLLRPSRFFGGRMELRVDLARKALQEIGLGDDLQAVSDSILRMTNASMAGALRLVSTARGIDPRGFTLVAYGGGGPIHGALVAEEIGIRKVLIPWNPGLSSAFGLLVSDTIIDVVRTDIHTLSDETMGEQALARIMKACREAAEVNGLTEGEYEIEIGLDLRYLGQAYELTVWTEGTVAGAASLREKFETEHRRRYSYSREALKVEVVNYRARLIERARPDLATSLPVPDGTQAQRQEITLGGKAMTATFLPRALLQPGGGPLAGPAIIEEDTTTTLVPAGWTATCLASGDLLLEMN